MNLPIILFSALLFCGVQSHDTEVKKQLDQALNSKQLVQEEYIKFQRQIEFKNGLNLQSRLDSMKAWGLGICYTEEYYFPKSDSFLVKEYYFSSEQETICDTSNKLCFPKRFYENGRRRWSYDFLSHPKGKEHLNSIRKHMACRKAVDKLIAVYKERVIHAGCSMTARTMKISREKANKSYRKPKMPTYFLTETFFKLDSLQVSFQLPSKQKFEVIVEGFSF